MADTKRYKVKKIRGKLSRVIGIKSPERMVNCVFGKKGSGKTFQTKKIIKQYARRFKKDKILILDAFNEYTDYKEITPKQIKTFRKPSRLLISKWNIGDVLLFIAQNFREGLLVVEGFGYLNLTPSQLNQFVAFITLKRTFDIDVMITGQSFVSIHPKLLQNTTAFRFHDTFDHTKSKDVIESRIHPYAQIAVDTAHLSAHVPCWAKGKMKKNRYKFCHYDAINQKIIGADKGDLNLAVYCYFKPKIDELTTQLTTY